SETTTEDAYPLGRSDTETRRLMQQGAFQRLYTQRFLTTAGLSPGMRVLDVGSGAGDVALLAGELVGRDGSVLGTDVNPTVLEVARERALAAGIHWVTFAEGDCVEIAKQGEFDAIIGRLVLIYQPDPAAKLRALSKSLRPGGILAFQEFNFAPESLAEHPPTPLWTQFWSWFTDTFRQVGIDTYAGYNLFRRFQEAGLPAPQMELASAVGGGPDWSGYEYAAATLRSILPLVLKFGLATAEEIDIDTLADRLRAETVASGGVARTPDLIGAWTRVD
ncbi:MAG TPA: class I SAM-dependent methyltransferase, partial [Nitrolancea sp.]|nr:class I SAM-dependent methyltransferase [Nitrolancea sp.]